MIHVMKRWKEGLGLLLACLIGCWALAGFAAFSSWKYSTGDLFGSNSIQENLDDVDDRLDAYGLTTATSDFTPPADGTYDLGTSALEWQDAFIDGLLHPDGITNSTAVNLWVDIVPGIDNTRDLGSATKEYKDAFIDGILNVDTISNSADIVMGRALATVTVTGDGTFNGDIVGDGSTVVSNMSKYYAGSTEGISATWTNNSLHTNIITSVGGIVTAASIDQ